MKRRLLELTGLAAAILAVIVLLKLAPSTVEGQTQTAAPPASATAKAGPAAKTSWGEPDLQGIWTNDYDTPLQRPARYAKKEFFTDEERAVLDRQRAGAIGQDARRFDRKSEQDVGGAYNAAIFLSHKHAGRRTSLIVDPPDGRIPPQMPEAVKDRKSTRLNSSHIQKSRMPSSA